MRWLGVTIACALGWSAAANAEVVVAINKSQQAMTVSINGETTYRWTVSTGRAGYGTPNGSFTAQRLAKVYFSKKYDDAPMPNSVFFYEGYAIHGTYEERRLGHAVSHGCVRLARANAATLFALVSGQGLRNTRVVITDGPPGVPMASQHRQVQKMARSLSERRARRAELRTRERRELHSAPRQEAQALPQPPSFERIFRDQPAEHYR